MKGWATAIPTKAENTRRDKKVSDVTSFNTDPFFRKEEIMKRSKTKIIDAQVSPESMYR